jgi:hypothetical protein
MSQTAELWHITSLLSKAGEEFVGAGSVNKRRSLFVWIPIAVVFPLAG